MANTPSITRPCADEIVYFSHSLVSAKFSRFVGALAVAIEAERDIENGQWCDPAFDGWLAEAEAAWEQATEHCRQTYEAPMVRPSDVPLRRMARHLNWTLGCESQAELRSAQRVIAGHPGLFDWQGSDPVSHRVSLLLSRARGQFDEICSLDMLESLVDASPINHTRSELPPAAETA